MNKGFPDKIHLEDAGMRGDSRLFRLEKDFRFFSSMGLITVPAGFVTDGASIPKIFHNILGPFGAYFPSALSHDFLYSPANNIYTRKQADDLFLEGMELLGVPWITRKTIYRAVRIFGGWSYKGKK